MVVIYIYIIIYSKHITYIIIYAWKNKYAVPSLRCRTIVPRDKMPYAYNNFMHGQYNIGPRRFIFSVIFSVTQSNEIHK